MNKLKSKFGALILLTVLCFSGSAFGQVSGTNDDSFPDSFPGSGDPPMALFTCFNFSTGSLYFVIAPSTELPALRLECTQAGGTVMTGY